MSARGAAVAGTFYPADADALALMVDSELAAVDVVAGEPAPVAIVAPHAGYRYSGPVAASAYRRIRPLHTTVRRVVLLGPAHRVYVRGFAVPSVDRFETPLGPVEVDRDAVDRLAKLPGVAVDDLAHADEHCLEVHLPFLKRVLDDFVLVPVLVGDAGDAEVAAVIDAAWGGPETLVVVSTDLSHYLDYASASARDRRTAEAVCTLDEDMVGDRDACGAHPLRGLLRVARERGLDVSLVDLRNSGDTAGPRDRVVGYGAFVLASPQSPGATTATTAPTAVAEDGDDAAILCTIAATAVARGLEGERWEPDPALYPERLRRRAGTFVTLERDGDLLGCVGSLTERDPLVVDVARHAYAAAFEDPRLPAVTHDDLDHMSIKVSELGGFEALEATSLESLLATLRPGVDGLVVKHPRGRATFLPSVWSTLPEPAGFVAALWRKAGLPRGYWSDDLAFERYTAVEYSPR